MRARLIVGAIAMTMGLGACAGWPGGPGHGPGPGPGPGRPDGMGGRWGADHTPGWATMSPQEREEHRARMQSARTYEECRRELETHHQRMVERARERGQAMPQQPMRDPCSDLKR
jgi:hypothetical protein